MARRRCISPSSNPFTPGNNRKLNGSVSDGRIVGYKTKRRNCKNPECAAYFTATRTDQIYCNAVCRNRAKVIARQKRDDTGYYLKLNRRAQGTIDYQRCKVCDKPYPRRSNNSKYCSVNCYNVGRKALQRAKYRAANPKPVVSQLVLSPDI